MAGVAIACQRAYRRRMPTRNISLTPQLDQVIEAAIASGNYENASEVVRAALRVFAAHQRTEDAKLEALRRGADSKPPRARSKKR